jgi:hypothetical protein
MASVPVFVYELSYYNYDGLLTTIDFNTIQEAEEYKTLKNIQGNIKQKEAYLELPPAELRIKEFISEEFLGYSIPKLDFRKCLNNLLLIENSIIIEKDVIMDLRGRPIQANYYYKKNNEIINLAKIEFIFNFDEIYKSISFRQELLSYYYDDDTLTDSFPISTEIYNPQNSMYHRIKGQEERELARENIEKVMIANLQPDILAYLQYLDPNKTASDMGSLTGNLFTKYSKELEGWKKSGDYDELVDLLNNDTQFDFLNLPFSFLNLENILVNSTVREFIIYCLQNN